MKNLGAYEPPAPTLPAPPSQKLPIPPPGRYPPAPLVCGEAAGGKSSMPPNCCACAKWASLYAHPPWPSVPPPYPLPIPPPCPPAETECSLDIMLI
eukprot:scaffold6014_cov139-Isochrysis_galbana.AAC.2